MTMMANGLINDVFVDLLRQSGGQWQRIGLLASQLPAEFSIFSGCLAFA